MSTTLQFVINVIVILLGPIAAVCITIFYQRYREKHSAKMRLFLNLMAHRKSYPPSISWAESLNLIDVVFEKHRMVVNLWHEYYDLLCDSNKDQQTREHKYLDLLSEMAKALGYKELQQTDIDKFYSPVAHADQKELNHKVQIEFLRVLENTEAFQTYIKDKKSELTEQSHTR